MNSLALRRIAAGRTAHGVVSVFIDGRDLWDLVRAVELPQATADGEPELAGGYAGLYADDWRDLPEQYGDGKAAVLGCECGVAGCWPLRVRITRRAGTVTWSDFEQPNRTWRYGSLGPFTFAADQYDGEIARLLHNRG